MYKISKYLIISSISFLFVFCSNISNKKAVTEGLIEYKIEYQESSRANPLISLLPTTMQVKFKNNNITTSIKGWLGIFKLVGIYNHDIQKKSALFKVMEKKFSYQADLSGESFGYDEMPKMHVEIFEDSIKEVAKYKCTLAKISFDKKGMQPISVYFTNEIPLKNSNFSHPFKGIDGVLMEYQMSFQGIEMRIRAESVKACEIDDAEFLIPDHYKSLSRKGIQNELDKITYGDIFEGTLTYNVYRADDKKTSPFSMKLIFKNNNYTLSLFKKSAKDKGIRIIYNTDKKKASVLLNGSKQFFTTDIRNVVRVFDKEEGVRISVNEDSVISQEGYTCFHADVESRNERRSVYYSEKIKIDSPHFFQPYPSFKKVLFNYHAKCNGVNMMFKVSGVNPDEISEEEFLVPSDYVKVDKPYVTKTIKQFLKY